MDVGLSNDLITIVSEIKTDALSWDTIVPKKGIFLGLDISKNSSGITLVTDGERFTANIILNDEFGDFKEVQYRRALKKDLTEVVKGKHFDLIIIEDSFVGENSDTTRLLFALNTAIDEIILDGVCSVDTFIRASNVSWKNWLSTVDEKNIAKGYNDKERIQIYMEMIGVVYSGIGFQDRLDSSGLIAGYFLKGRELHDSGELGRRRKVNFNDVEANYALESSYLLYGRDDIDRDSIEFVNNRRISKNIVLEYLNKNPDKVYITKNRVVIGTLGETFNLDMVDGGGYFAFWINPKKLKKYKIK